PRPGGAAAPPRRCTQKKATPCTAHGVSPCLANPGKPQCIVETRPARRKEIAHRPEWLVVALLASAGLFGTGVQECHEGRHILVGEGERFERGIEVGVLASAAPVKGDDLLERR